MLQRVCDCDSRIRITVPFGVKQATDSSAGGWYDCYAHAFSISFVVVPATALPMLNRIHAQCVDTRIFCVVSKVVK